MAHRITIIAVDGTKRAEKRDAEPTLEELQTAVGGYIERVAMPDDFAGDLWVNEEGLINNLPYNTVATEFAMVRWLRAVEATGLNLGMLHLHGPAVLVEPIAERVRS